MADNVAGFTISWVYHCNVAEFLIQRSTYVFVFHILDSWHLNVVFLYFFPLELLLMGHLEIEEIQKLFILGDRPESLSEN